EGLLVEAWSAWTPDAIARRRAFELLKVQTFASAFAGALTTNVDPDYHDALAGYATWRAAELPLPERYAALHFACAALARLCQRAAPLARLSTLARVAWEAGQRGVSVWGLRLFGDLFRRGESRIDEPFWPANPRFDTVSPGVKPSDWFFCSALE